MTSSPIDVRIPRGPLTLAGHLHRPDQAGRGGALVIATPGSSVKEQIAGNYARRLADRGWVVLAFDPAYQGQSDGEPRDLEDPHARVDDIRFAVDYLATLDDVERVGLLGVCAGGGYAVTAAMTDRRIEALATVVPVNIGRAFRQADTSPGAVLAALDDLGRERTAAAHGDEAPRRPWLPDTLEAAAAAGITDPDVLQAIRFYRTPRGFSEHSTNRRHPRSDALLLGYDAFHLAAELLTQPLQVVVGGRLGSTGSYHDGLRLWELASNAKDFLVIDGAGHYELYDEPRYVDQAVERLDAFFGRWLG